MGAYNFINHNSNFSINRRCIHDSNIGYASNFSIDGDVDGWRLYDGIYTYGAWSGILFGTLYTDFGMIGRDSNISPVDGEFYYNVIITMLINTADRKNEQQKLPKKAKLMWTTSSDDKWDDDKSKVFDIYTDGFWHTYDLNMAEEQNWVGNISNLRLYPILEEGKLGDEFAIKKIQIKSIDKFDCNQVGCSYYSNYSHPCGGAGKRGYCESEFIDQEIFNIKRGVNDTLIININNYGYEEIQIPEDSSLSPQQLAINLIKNIGIINIGGFAEAQVVFTEHNTFILYTGTYTDDSNVEILYSKLAEEMGFFDKDKNPIYSSSWGETPATHYTPFSTFLTTYNQLLNIFDNSLNTYIVYDPLLYNLEGGRSDWLNTGLGSSTTTSASPDQDQSGTDLEDKKSSEYKKLDGVGKTIVDLTHPFNASGRINHIDICGTVDYGYENVYKDGDGQLCTEGEYGWGRLYTKGAKVKIFRPLKDGYLKLVKEIDIEDRKSTKSEDDNLYSEKQFHIDVDCDVFVNKGDLIGVYNVNIYYGKTLNEEFLDARYYYIDGDVDLEDVITPPEVEGRGSAGLLVYGRSDTLQDRLALDLDLNDRVNIRQVDFNGYVEDDVIKFNIMRCLDMEWDIDLFGKSHMIGYRNERHWNRPWKEFEVPNEYYGKRALSDGVYTVKDGLAAEGGFTVGDNNVIPSDPNYFWVNGDHEWMGVYHWPEWWRTRKKVWDFKEDPIAFSVIFPHNSSKKIYKFAAYFRERENFRSFALSTYLGPNNSSGDADDSKFKLIPEYKAVTLDNVKYSEERGNKHLVEDFLFDNPSVGIDKKEYDNGSGKIINYDSWIQASDLRWNFLEHEWEPIEAYGFRFYTDFHESTAISEMELYAYIDNFSANLASFLSVSSSFYGDTWFNHKVEQSSDSKANSYVDNAIQYISIEFEPVNRIKLINITGDTTGEYVYFGDKGSEDNVNLKHNKTGTINKSQEVKIKNNYDGDYNLFVDVPENVGYNERVLYYSSLSSEDDVFNPLVGPGAHLTRRSSYTLLNQDHNVNINSDCYGLKNFVLDKKAFYNYNQLYSWLKYNDGDVIESDYIDFHNLPDNSYSLMKIKPKSRNRYWRLKASSYYNDFKINEIKVYKDGKLLDCKFYHNRDGDITKSGNGRSAPHLDNDSVTGSYYRLTENQFITIDLGKVDYFDTLIIYHETVKPYSDVGDTTPHFFCGVDKNTYLYIEDNNFENYIKDTSYYENELLNIESVSFETFAPKLSSVNKVYDFATDLESYTEWYLIEDGNEAELNYITPSGTVSGSEYQYPGYIDFNFHLTQDDTSFTGMVANLKREEMFFYRYDDFINPQFNIKCKIEFDEEIDSSKKRIGLGITERRTTTKGRWWYTRRHSLNGAQIVFDGSGIGIDVKKVGSEDNIDTVYTDVTITSGTVYYCDFSFDGDKTYDIKVYDGGWDSEYLIGEATLESDNWWEADRFCFAGIDGPRYEAEQLGGKLYYVELNGETIQTGQLPSWDESIKFDGSDSSYLKIPYDRGFDLNSSKFSFDFFIRGQEFPVCVYDKSKNINMYPHNIETDQDGYFGWHGYLETDSYIQCLNDSCFNLEDKDFAIDFRYKFRTIKDKNTFFSRENTYCFYYDAEDAGKLKFDGYKEGSVSSDISGEAEWQPEEDVWYHMSVTRNNNNLNFFVDGVLLDSTTISGSYEFPYDLDSDTDYNFYIGALHSDGDFSNFLDGYIEEFRYTYDYYRWSESFTPPSVTYKVDSFTKMLIRFDDRFCNIIENYDHSWDASEESRAFILRLAQQDKTYWVELLYGLYDQDEYCVWKIPTYYSTLKENMWYHIFVTSAYGDNNNGFRLSINNQSLLERDYTKTNAGDLTFNPGNNDILIGRKFNGNLKHFRFSKTNTTLSNDWEGVRLNSDNDYSIPFYGYSKLYEMGLYSSSDGASFNKVYDVDLMFSTSYNSYSLANLFSSYYNSFFAIDLGKRYSLSMVRSYGSDDAHDFDINNNTYFSNMDTSEVNDIFYLFDPTEYFEKYDRTLPENYIVEKNEAALYHKDNSLYFKTSSAEEASFAKAVAKYIGVGNFDIQFRYIIYNDSYDDWKFSFILSNVNSEDEDIVFERGVIDGASKQLIKFKDKLYTSYEVIYSESTSAKNKDIRVVRESSLITFYNKNIDSSDWEEIISFSINTDFWLYNKVIFNLSNSDPRYAAVEFGLDNFIVNEGTFYYDDYTDARWVTVALLNGDGVDRFINKMGIYTNIQKTIAPPGGYYNNEWDYLGKELTRPVEKNNVALGSEVEVSSYVESMIPEKITDGSTGFGENSAWGSEEESNPYAILDLGSEYEVNKVVIHHGLIEGSTDYIVNDYEIEFSKDGESFDSVKSVSDNESFETEHNIFPAQTTRYVKIDITKYNSRAVYFSTSDQEASYYFRGAVLREVEVFEATDDVNIISSEVYPIVAFNLKAHHYLRNLVKYTFETAPNRRSNDYILLGMDNYVVDYVSPGDYVEFYDEDGDLHEFTVKKLRYDQSKGGYYIDTVEDVDFTIPESFKGVLRSWSHEAEGVDDEGFTTDWPTRHDNFCYSDSNTDDIQKVYFRDFGEVESYDKWVVIRNDTATSYNEGPDYFKSLKIAVGTKPNPTNHFWWWYSNHSVLSNSMEYSPSVSDSLLKIHYPSSNVLDNIYLYEVSDFGIDTDCRWRDGFSFILYIKGLDNIDFSEGCVYMGGYDSVTYETQVIYKWSMELLSDFLREGKNMLFLKFSDADEVVYTSEYEDGDIDYNTRDVSKIFLKTIGFDLKGKDTGDFDLLIDGFLINKNSFESYIVKENRADRGCYITGGTYLKLPLSNLNLNAGFISFWLSPDFRSNGIDIFGGNKIRNLFNIYNNNNDVFGCFISNYFIEIYFGNLNDSELKSYSLGAQQFSDNFMPGDMLHFAITFSNNGKSISSDGSTVKIFINNNLYTTIYETWKYVDSKYFNLTIGGPAANEAISGLSLDNSSVDGVIGDLKVGNYCKTDFTDEMHEGFDINNISTYNSNKLVEISKDNVTFYKAGDTNLPFFFEQVSPGEEIPIYIRSNLEDIDWDMLNHRTGSLIIQWEFPI